MGRLLRQFYIGFILGALGALALALCAEDVHARNWVLGLDELSIEYKNYELVNDKARNLLIYPEHPKEGINVNINTDILTYLYWDSQIQSLTTGSQYRAIGLETRLGLRLSQYLYVGYWHHSQHLMDRAPATLPRFPSEDAVELKLFLFRAKSGRESLF